jgi:hypothetical protein
MSKGFLDCKPHVATDRDMHLPWGGAGFQCSLCGHRFRAGDTYRFVFANATKNARMGNFFVCLGCDGEDVLDRAILDYDKVVGGARRWGIRR